MPAPSLPVSRIVAVSVQLTPAGAKSQSLSDLLLLGTSTIIDTVERSRTYSDLTSIANDFGTTAEEYLAAAKWFGQSPQPKQLIVGRWVNAAARGGIRGATLSASQQAIANFTAVTTGSLKIGKDGGAPADVLSINLSGAANLNAVAAILQTAIAGTTVKWNSSFARFEIESTTASAASAISFLTTAASGTFLGTLLGLTAANSGAYLYTGQVAETAVAAVQLLDSMLGQKFYAVHIPTAVDTDHLAVAAFLEGTNTKHIYGVATQSAGVLVATDTTNIAYLLKQLNYSRTFTQFSSSDKYAVMSALARILTTDFSGSSTVMTLKFKQEPGVVAESLNATQVNAARAINANIFVNYNNDTAILQEGTMANGTFLDIVTGTDWLATQIQRSVYNLLYTSLTKIPQTDQGMQLLTTAVEAVCSQGVVNGLLAPGVWNANGFGLLKQGDLIPKGYYVYNAPVATQNQADRTSRLAMPIQVAAKLAGAIHFADIAISVNQ
jgi:Protein of unknown function (DUF3383)